VPRVHANRPVDLRPCPGSGLKLPDLSGFPALPQVTDAVAVCYICCDDNPNALRRRNRPVRIERISPAEISTDLLDRLTSGETDVLVISGTSGPDLSVPVGADLVQEFVSKAALRLSGGGVHAYPYSAIHGSPGLSSDDYLTAACNSESDIRALVGDSVVDALYDTLGAFGIGRQQRLTAHDGRPFAAFTLRLFSEGGQGVGIHCENAFLEELEDEFRRRLERQVQLDEALSFFTVIHEPGKGGGLVLYDLTWDDAPIDLAESTVEERHPANVDFFRSKGYGLPQSETLAVKDGDTIVFQASRLWHAVNPVTDGNRVTMGCFLAKDGLGAYHFWA